MQLDATQRQIAEVIPIGDHVIPRYQRPYAWEEQQLRDLWFDLARASPESHFLGNMVVHRSGDSQWDVVDGQQRLTTIMIALSALIDSYKKLNEEGRAGGLKEYLQRVDLTGKTTFRLVYRGASGYLHLRLLSDESQRVQEPLAQTGAEKAQAEAFRILKALIDEEVDVAEEDPVKTLDDIRDRFLRATVVYVRVEGRKDAFTIFETLNDRGQSLDQVDLVKNLVISAVEETPGRQEESLWESALSNIHVSTWPKLTAEGFLGHFWNSTSYQANDEIVQVLRIRRTVDTYLDAGAKEDQAKRFIKLFHQTSEILRHFDDTLASPNGRHWRSVVAESRWDKAKFEGIDRLLYGSLVTTANQPLPLLFSLFRNFLHPGEVVTVSTKAMRNFLRAIEAFQFRWSIAQKSSTSSIRKLYRKAAFAVDQATDTSGVDSARLSFIRDANAIMASDTQFKDGLKRLTYFSSRPQDVHRVRHTLERIEEHWGSSQLPHQDMSLEHLEGQGQRSTSSRQNFWVGKLGNLTLLPPDVNSHLPETFADKAPILAEWINKKDHILHGQIRRKEWDNSAANKRMDQLVNTAIEIWPKTIAP